MRVMLILEDISSKMGVYNRMPVILPMCKISKSGGIFMRKQNRLKITAAVLAGFLVLTDTAYAQGGISGKVLKSDIRAYINGEPIMTYNIDGYTGVIAEELRNYGFDVEWSPESRKLFVNRDYQAADINNEHNFSEPDGQIKYAYETDIVTYVGGNEAKSFNIGGMTVIQIKELDVFGDVVWDEGKREVHYTDRMPWTIDLSSGEESAVHEGMGPYKDGINGIKAVFTKNEQGIFDAESENLGHFSWINLSYDKELGGLQLGFSIVAHHMMADVEFSNLCTDMCTIGYDGTRWKETPETANKHMKILINGEPVHIKDVRMGKGNNHQDYYFILDLDIQKEDINSLSIECNI